MMRKNHLMVVVHAVSGYQVLRNIDVAFEGQADGVFLINHGIPAHRLRDIYLEAKNFNPEVWMGLNFLDLGLDELEFYFPSSADALWCDNVGYDESSDESDQKVVELYIETLKSGQMLFGGLDFKYQKVVVDLPKAIRLLSDCVDVITTSGPKTGYPPDVSKIQRMRDLAGPVKPIAIASGMTPENVDPFLDLADYFLVATGISKSFTELDPVRVRMMADKMRR